MIAAETSGESAVKRCEQLSQERPESAAAQFNLGLAYTRKGRAERAEKAYRKAVELDPDLVEAWVNLGGVLLLRWDFQGCLEANRQALERQEDLLLAHYNMGQACLYLGDGEGLVACSRRVLGLDPKHAAGHYYLAVGLLATGRVAEARQNLSHAMALGYQPMAEFLRSLSRAEGQQAAKGVTSNEPRTDSAGETKEE
jgi:tetratricopeptide (TPR) repeat protein